MYNFCPHCGKTIGQEQVPGKPTACKYCGKPIGPAVQAQTLGVVHTQTGAGEPGGAADPKRDRFAVSPVQSTGRVERDRAAKVLRAAFCHRRAAQNVS